MNRNELLKEIQLLDFALQDTILYLNLHPEDEEANCFLRNVKKQLVLHIREYERNFTTLDNRSPFTNDHMSYVKDAWPWERKGKGDC